MCGYWARKQSGNQPQMNTDKTDLKEQEVRR
jgi:hypothetical protein